MSETKELQKFLLQKYSSKEEFLRAYRAQYSEKGKFKNLYTEVLQDLKRTIETGNADGFKNVFSKFGYISSVENQEVLKEFYGNDTNPLKTTNLIILICKHNQLKILSYILGNTGNLKYFHPKIDLNDKDEFGHNAIYYAILSGDIKLLDTLINKWPAHSHSDQLEDILSQQFDELKKLKNVELSKDIVIFIEKFLFDKRFFSENPGLPKEISININNIEKRVELFMETINLLNLKSEKIDQEFLYIMKSIVFNMSTLKRLLKSTYNELPWEELEFCLTSFVLAHTKKLHVMNFYSLAHLKKSEILKQLNNFADHLTRLRKNWKNFDTFKIAALPLFSRKRIVESITKKHPEYEDLYSAFQKVRDICSLHSIINYVDCAVSADCKEKEGQLIITRALQVIGENLKNTLESPKLSEQVSEVLLQYLPNNTRQIIKNLRNFLSHESSLTKREELEKSPNDTFYADIQSDIKKIGEVIGQILTEHKIKALEPILRKINDLKSASEFIDIFKNFEEMPLQSVGCEQKNPVEISKLVKELFQQITDKNQEELKVFAELNKIVKSQDAKIIERRENYEQAFRLLEGFKRVFRPNFGEDDFKFMKQSVNDIMHKLSDSEDDKKVAEKISFLVNKIYDISSSRLSEETKSDINRIIFQINYKTGYSVDNISRIEHLQDVLSDVDRSDYTREDYKAIYNKKLEELKEILDNNEFSDKFFENYTFYAYNRNLQIAVEMLVLDILTILGKSENILENNVLFLEECSPVLVGKSLRNHLAHDNLFVYFLGNTQLTTYLTACKIASENLLENRRLIGKMVADNPEKLRSEFYNGLKIIKNQHEMFSTIEAGSLDELKTCLNKGAEILGRDLQNSTAFHFSCKSNNLGLIKFILSTHRFEAKIKNNLGQSPLHLAASLSSQNSEKIVEYLLDKIGIPVDILNNKKQSALHLACENGCIESVKVLLKHHANISSVDDYGLVPLQHAATNNHLDLVKLLSRKTKIDKFCMDSDLNFCIHLAAEQGYLSIIEYLLECGVDPNFRREDSRPVLQNAGKSSITLFNFLVKIIYEILKVQTAALNGHMKVVKKLIAAGADIHLTTSNGCSALHHAVENDHYEISKMLIELGAEVNLFDLVSNSSPIFHAAQNGNVEIIKLLINNGAIVNRINSYERTPLIMAVCHGHAEVAEILLKNRADPFLRGLSSSALHYAIGEGSKEVVEVLLKYQTDVNVRGYLNTTPLHLYSKLWGLYDSIVLLIKQKADVNAKDVSGATPVLNAISNGNKAILQLLLENKAKVIGVMDQNGVSPMHAACFNKFRDIKEIMQILLQKGCDINAKIKDGSTPLHLAVVQKNIPAIEFLINNHVEIDAKDYDGQTALMLALEFNHLKIAKLLIENGADIKIKQKDLDLLAIATNKNNLEIVELLLSRNLRNLDYRKALIIAIYRKNRKIFEMLIEKCNEIEDSLHLICSQDLKGFLEIAISKGCNINSRGHGGWRLLHSAAKWGSYGCAEILIENGAELDFITDDRATPLILASSNGHTQVVKLLLEKGANVKIRDQEPRNAFEYSITAGHLDVVKVFFELNKVDVNEKGENEWTAMHLACQTSNNSETRKGNNLEIVKYLVEHGYDVHASCDRGTKPIHYAARNGFTDILEYLFKRNLCTVDEVCFGNFSLLHYAVAGQQLETTKFLIQNQVKINAYNDNGETVLHLAATSNFVPTVRLLLENHAICNGFDAFEKTPIELTGSEEVVRLLSSTERLIEAVKGNKVEKVKQQIKNGAVVNAKDLLGFTSVHYTSWEGFGEVLDILLEQGANPNVIGLLSDLSPLHYACKVNHYHIAISLLKNGAIFNLPTKEEGKLPVDYTKTQEIRNVLTLIAKVFKMVKINDATVKNEIMQIEDQDVMKAVFNAKNTKGNTLLMEALIHKCSYINDLKSVLQDNPNQKIQNALKLKSKGQYRESFNVLNILLEQRVEIFGPENPAVYDLKFHIAKIMFTKGEYKKSYEIYEELFLKYKNILGSNHVEILKLKAEKALILHKFGKNYESMRMLTAVYKKQKETLGDLDLETINTFYYISLVLNDLERYEEALNISEGVLKIRTIKMGEKNHSTLEVQHTTAKVLENSGKLEEAIKMYQEVHQKQTSVLGEFHADTMRTLCDIFMIQSQDNAEVLKKLQEIFKLQKRFLGAFHPDTLTTQYNLGSLLYDKFKYTEAYKVLQENLERKKIVFGADHPINSKIEKKIKDIEKINKFNNDLTDQKLLTDKFLKACEEGKLNLVKNYLSYGISIDEIDDKGRNGLHFAVDNGHESVVRFLLQAHIDVTHPSYKGNTALHTASNKNLRKIAEILIEHVKDNDRKKLNDFLNFQTTSGEATAMHIAAKNNSLDLIKILLKNGAIYNMKNKTNQQPVELANNQKVKKFLESFDSVFSQTKDGDTEVLKKLNNLSLKDFPVFTNARNNHDLTLLQVAISNKHKSIVSGISGLLKSKV